MSKLSKALPVILVTLCASRTWAEGTGFYLGGGIINSKVDQVPVLASLGPPAINTGSWKIFAGFRPIHLIAAEADYYDLGSVSTQQLTPMECVDFGSCETDTHSD